MFGNNSINSLRAHSAFVARCHSGSNMPERRVEPSRRTTDARLGTERAKTDDELAKRVAAADQDADRILRKARRRATAVLRVGRAREDVDLRARRASQPERNAVAEARTRADDRLRNEYVRADRSVADERKQRAQIVSALLGRERRHTNQGLLLERVTADEVLRRRDDFLGIVSHDLRNELAGIALNVTQILAAATDDDAGRRVVRWAANIQRSNLRMTRVLGDLLDLARIEANQLSVVLDDHDVRTVVGNAVQSFQEAAAAKGVSLKTDLPSRGPALKLDAERIHQVFANLLTNALNFSPEGGEVSIRVETRRNETYLSVSDNGPGIAAHRREQIFDQFRQGPNSNRKGLGLGLYIAKRIVEAHGGRIWAESSPRRGATVVFTLPVAQSTKRRRSPPSPQATAKRGRHTSARRLRSP